MLYHVIVTASSNHNASDFLYMPLFARKWLQDYFVVFRCYDLSITNQALSMHCQCIVLLIIHLICISRQMQLEQRHENIITL